MSKKTSSWMPLQWNWGTSIIVECSRSTCKTSCSAHSYFVRQLNISIQTVLDSGWNCKRTRLSFSHAQVSARPCNNKEAPPRCDRPRTYIDGSFHGDPFEAPPPRRAATVLCLRCVSSPPAHGIPGNEEQIISSDGRTPVWSDERIARWLGASRERERTPRNPPLSSLPHLWIGLSGRLSSTRKISP